MCPPFFVSRPIVRTSRKFPHICERLNLRLSLVPTDETLVPSPLKLEFHTYGTGVSSEGTIDH